MRKITNLITILSLITAALSACSKKDVLDGPVTKPVERDTTTTTPPPPPPPETHFPVSVRAIIEVGKVVYDSLQTRIILTSWDSSDVASIREISLDPGTDTIMLPKKDPRFKLHLKAWDTEAVRHFTREELQTATAPIVMRAGVQAKKLKSEASYLLIQGEYQMKSKIEYFYNGNGSLKHIHFFQNKPHSAEIHHFWTDRFTYSGNDVERITRFDDENKEVATTDFTWTSNGLLTNIYQNSFGNITTAAVQHGTDLEHTTIDMDMLFGNGHSMVYSMKFKNGNKVWETARSSTGAGEGGNYTYDLFINPYHQMNWPDLYFRHSSKNNQTVEDKGYTGSQPVVAVYKTVYTYDQQGYPTQVVKSYRNYLSGEHMYDTKTMYFY